MKKWIEIVLGVILLLLLIFRGAELWLGSKIKRVAATELHNMSDGLYQLDIGRLSVGLFDRSVKIKNVSIVTDSSRLEHLTTQIDTTRSDSVKTYKPCLKITIAELFVKGVWFKRHTTPPADSAYNGSFDGDLHQAVSRSFEKLSVNRIRMRGIDASYSVRKERDTLYYNIKRTTVEADDYDINSDPSANPLHCHDVRLNMRKFDHTYEQGAMTIFVDTLRASTREGSLTANALRIEPNYPKEEFARENPKHLDWSFYTIRSLRLSGVDFPHLVYDKQISVDSVRVGRFDAGSYKDRNIDRVEWRKYMFYETLFRLKLPVEIGTVGIADGSAFYEELPRGETVSGTIKFDAITATITGLSNHPDNPAKHIRVEATGRVMDAGELKMEFLAPARKSETRFEMTASMGPMEMKVMNPLLEPLGKVRVDDGRVNSVNIHVTGNTYRSHVEMKLLYDNLHVSIMKEDKLGFEHPRVFISALANNLVLRNSNPDKWGKLHIGTGSFERDLYRSQFNYMWKSVYPGIKSSIGVPESLGN